MERAKGSTECFILNKPVYENDVFFETSKMFSGEKFKAKFFSGQHCFFVFVLFQFLTEMDTNGNEGQLNEEGADANQNCVCWYQWNIQM